jgi:hypothetical protein
MVNAWKQADDFNKLAPIGTVVLIDEKPATISDHAYVVNPNQIVVQVNNNQTPIRLSNIKLTS